MPKHLIVPEKLHREMKKRESTVDERERKECEVDFVLEVRHHIHGREALEIPCQVPSYDFTDVEYGSYDVTKPH